MSPAYGVVGCLICRERGRRWVRGVMIGGRRFKVFQSEALGVDANEIGQLEQVELFQVLV